MLLGMMVVGSSALSFNDADDISNVTAATVLEELGVMQGDGQGNFMPDQSVTRAQMAILICRILYGDKLNVRQFEGTTQYTDVGANDYYTGYINLATSLGIINGYGDGRFGPDDTVTTAQAALMLSRALGYFKANELADAKDWALASVAQATKINMFGNLKLATNDLLARDNVAEMVFNTMTKAVPVQYSERWDVYYTDSQSIIKGVEFDYSDTLGYQNFDLVYDTVSFTDDFGRPATAWGVGRYTLTNVDAKGDLIQGTGNVVLLDIDAAVVEAQQADLTYTKGVTGKALASAVGNTAMGYTWSVRIDGASASNVGFNDGNDKPIRSGNTNDGENYGLTGKGVLTEIYIDGSTPSGTVTVVYTNTYLAKVTRVSSDDDGRYVTVTLESTIVNGAIDDRNFHTSDFAVDDYVLVTVAEDDRGDSYIAPVKLADTVEGPVTAYNATGANSYISLDGKRYDCAARNAQDVDDSGAVDFTDYRLYLDSYGYAIGYEQIGSTIDEYLYIANVNPNGNTYVDGWQARAVFPDGSSKIINIVKKSNGDGGQTLAQQVYRYELQDDGSYYLPGTGNITGTAGNPATGFIRGNEAAIYAGDNRTGNLVFTTDRNTKFVHVVDTLTFNGYVGYNNVPSIKAGNSAANMMAVFCS